MAVEQGEIIALVGANASGKSTLVNTLAGVNRPRNGAIQFLGEDITGVPGHSRVGRGLVLIPEARHLFPFMSVMDNLQLGCYWDGARKYQPPLMRGRRAGAAASGPSCGRRTATGD